MGQKGSLLGRGSGRALSKVFRGKHLDGLNRAYRRGQLTFGGSTAELADEQAFADFCSTLTRTDWVVYAKQPFLGPDQDIAYLGRYTHRIAISNNRLVSLDDEHVALHWRDYRDDARMKVMRLKTGEFIPRFLPHVLPPGFMRIRHYGLFANRHRRQNLARCRALLDQPEPEPQERESSEEIMLRLTGRNIRSCPHCQLGRLQVIEILPSQRGPP